MITMTLLDGTVVSLPVGGKKAAEEPADESLTTRDLIAALVARAEGKDVSAILPEGKWEPIFAALLAILLRKGLMADWEFVEEWSKHKR
jgi:type IV pilus assembly protein PilB